MLICSNGNSLVKQHPSKASHYNLFAYLCRVSWAAIGIFQGVPCIGVACMHAWVACDCRYRYKPWPKAALTGELTKTQVCTVKHSWDVRRQSLIAHIVSACSMLWTSVLISLSWQWVSPSSLCSLRGVHSFQPGGV